MYSFNWRCSECNAWNTDNALRVSDTCTCKSCNKEFNIEVEVDITVANIELIKETD